MLRSLTSRFRRTSFHNDERGVAMIEFAIAVPLLALVVYGGVEMGRYLLIKQKLDRVTATIANVVAQAGAYKSSDVDLILTNAGSFMRPFNLTTNGAVIVTSVLRNNANNKIITWQQRMGKNIPSNIGPAPAGNCTTPTTGTATALPADIPSTSGSNAIVVEAFYDFVPIVRQTYLTPSRLYVRTFHVPRFGTIAFDSAAPDPCPALHP